MYENIDKWKANKSKGQSREELIELGRISRQEEHRASMQFEVIIKTIDIWTNIETGTIDNQRVNCYTILTFYFFNEKKNKKTSKWY